MSVIRRYVAIIQDPRGYPPPGELDPAPPDGPAQVMVFSVVKADEHDDAIRGAVEDLRWVADGLADINSGRRRNLGITRNCEVRLREVIARLGGQ